MFMLFPGGKKIPKDSSEESIEKIEGGPALALQRAASAGVSRAP